MKRLLDIALSILALVFLSPVLLLVAVIILITDGRPIFFNQPRIGRGGKEFTCYKFRSMSRCAPAEVATCELKNADQYITPFGKLIRRTSIDELPQLLNVLKGDMSLVGPRPLIKAEADIHQRRTQAGVYAVRPGITGWAQVNGRDGVSREAKVEYDTYYVKHQSLRLDLQILVRTVTNVLQKKDIHEGEWAALNVSATPLSAAGGNAASSDERSAM